MMSASYHKITTSYHLLLGLVLSASVLFTTAHADAQLKPTDKAAKDYRQARRLIEKDADSAFELAKGLPKFRYADEQRIELVGQAALSAGKAPEGVEFLLDFADRTDSFRSAYAARLDAAELLILLGERSRAESLLEKLDRDHKKLRGRYSTRRHLSARAIRLRHDLAQTANNDRLAKSLATELLVAFPNEDATRRPGLAITPDDLSESRRFSRARAFYRAWAYKDARAEFERFLDDSSRKETAKWHLAQIALNKLRDDFPKAEEYFEELAKGGRYAQESLYQLARAKMRQERYDECLSDLNDYVERYPRGSRVELVYYYRGWLPYDHRENDKAIRELKKYIDRYGRRGRRSTYIYGFLAWTYMRESRWEDAIDAWDDMLPFGNPLVAGKAYYWKAYAQVQLDKKERAIDTLDTLRKRYPLSYYGMLGEQLRAKIEGKDERASKVWWPEGTGSYDDKPRVEIEDLDTGRLTAGEREQFKRVKELAALDEKRLARQELSPIYNSVLRTAPSSERDEWIHALGFLVDDYNKMWVSGARGSISYLTPVPDDNKLRSVMAYPRAYREDVDRVAKEFGLPPYLIWAIMRQESRYKPSAISHTDAVGALQMIPKTARKVAKDLGIEYNPRTFHYPEVGFRFSGFYMRKLLDTFGGMFTPMAGSYNSGPQVIARWFRRNPEASFPWLIEEFEYNEGRAYSRKVTEHMTRYIYLYEKDPEVRAKLLDKMYPLSRDIDLPEDVGY
jgi:outer membrane protein assembly factor BamD (BamD/ComL family)